MSKQRSHSQRPDNTTSVISEGRSPNPRRKPCVSPSLKKKIEYNESISIDQIIEYKLRAIKTGQSEQKLRSQPAVNEYPAVLFETIEAFLDMHELFIVSPAPVKKRILISRTTKNQKIVFENFEETIKQYNESEMHSSDEEKQMKLVHSKSTHLPNHDDDLLLQKVSTSSLIQRRMRVKVTEIEL